MSAATTKATRLATTASQKIEPIASAIPACTVTRFEDEGHLSLLAARAEAILGELTDW